MKKAKTIYYWVRNNVKYRINADYSSVNVLKRMKTMNRYRNTNCTGHTNLLNVLSRTARISAAYYYFKPVKYRLSSTFFNIYLIMANGMHIKQIL